MSDSVFQIIGSNRTSGTTGIEPSKNANGSPARQGTSSKHGCSGQANASNGVLVSGHVIFNLGAVTGSVTIDLLPAQGGALVGEASGDTGSSGMPGRSGKTGSPCTLTIRPI